MLQTSVRIDRAAVRRRIVVLAMGVFCWALCMGYRLVDLQVLRSGEMRAQARRQQEQVISLDARRGLLYDRDGRELAMSIEVDSIVAVPSAIEDPAATAARLSPVLDPARGRTQKAIAALTERLTGDGMFVWVRRKVDPGVRAAVEQLDLKGITFVREHKRFYPHGGLAAHAIGWAGMDNKGMAGLELYLDDRIRGRNGQLFALRDARGKKFLKVTRREPTPGDGVVLTIDEAIQHITERELHQAMEDTGAAAGTAIVLDPATGDVLAMANEPTYNPNKPGESTAEQRRNRAILDAYEPGSTFKVVTMAAALEQGLVRPTEVIDCQNGAIRVGRAVLHDHKPFGMLTATEILEHSSNVGAIKIGLRLPQDAFYDTIRSFGFGEKTGIEMPAESRGILRAPDDWSGLSQATMSFGQEIGVTPLQLVTAIAAVANGGVLQPPRAILRTLDPEGRVIEATQPREPRRIISERTAESLRRMMMTVVDDGTAKAARMPGYSIAGKTGTAQKIGPGGGYDPNRFVASFVGFVPASRPALTILVVLDEPRGSMYHGGDIAAPVFRRIALPALRYLGVPPEDGRLIEEGDEPTLTASAHARRWIEPLPIDEKERRAEQERHRREAEQREKNRARGDDDDSETMVVPAKKPLPAPGAMVRGDGVLVADLQGYSLRRAVGYLSRAGLRARIEPGDGTDAYDGVVVAQEPEAGALMAPGGEVTLRPGRFALVPPEEADEEIETGDPAARAAVARARRSMR